MSKWEIASVIPPELVGLLWQDEQEKKLQALLEEGFEPFGVMCDRIWLRRTAPTESVADEVGFWGR